MYFDSSIYLHSIRSWTCQPFFFQTRRSLFRYQAILLINGSTAKLNEGNVFCRTLGFDGVASVKTDTDLSAMNQTLLNSKLHVHSSSQTIYIRVGRNTNSGNWTCWRTTEYLGESWPFWAPGYPVATGNCGTMLINTTKWMAIQNGACGPRYDGIVCDGY